MLTSACIPKMGVDLLLPQKVARGSGRKTLAGFEICKCVTAMATLDDALFATRSPRRSNALLKTNGGGRGNGNTRTLAEVTESFNQRWYIEVQRVKQSSPAFCSICLDLLICSILQSGGRIN